MFGFGGTTGFGQPAQQPAPAFGAQPASPFGAAFGQPAQPAASPFGATASSAPLFGAQSPAPAFGQAAPAAAPSFGATTNTGFGATTFGAAAKPAGFGGFGTTTTAAPNPFGATTQTSGSFGATAQSAPAFGAGLGTAPSFGATLSPTPAFGAASTPAFGAPQSAPAFGGFGATNAPAFGAPTAAPANPFGATTGGFGATAAPAFGAAPAATGFGAPAAPTAAPFGTTSTNLFGAPSAAPSPFGAPTQPAAGFGGFGAAPAAAATPGTRNVPYSKTKDSDVAAGQPATFLMSISALSNYQPPNPAKSHEELRWEDYQEGVKNQSAGPAPTAAGAFGAPAPAAGGFGGFGATAQPATTGFGATATTNPFGAPASAPAFGAAAAPAFGAVPSSQPSLFGTTPAPAASANPFGASTAPAFGGFGAAPAAASQPSLFGSTTTTGFGTSAPFGPATPAFGASSSAAAFSFTNSPSTFGAASAPAASLFGTASAPASSPFGATTTLGAVGSPFGGASSASAFGTSTFGAFGAAAAKPTTPFGAPTATTPFGATAPATGGGLFSSASPFSFNTQPASSPAVFGAMGPAGASTMSFASSLFNAPASAPAAGGLFGATAATAAPAQPPTVAQPAYGNFGSLPTVPDAKVGITTRAVRNHSISSGASKASPLLSLRPTPVRYGASVRTRQEPSGLGFGLASTLPPATGTAGVLPSTSLGATAASDLLTPQPAAGTGSTITAGAAGVGVSGLLPLRQNPHRLFIAAPPPSTEAAGGASFLSPARPSSAPRGAVTPDGPGGMASGHDGLHVDGSLPETPAGRHGGVNGYANGHSGGAAGAAMPASGATGRAPATTMAAASMAFQDAPTSELHLPRLGPLVAEGFSFSPNVDELRLLHSQNRDNLASVSNFTVTRAGVGHVRWVVPVDVRGLALYDIVSIKYGEVSCYPNPSTKPPQGQGLNKSAEITLYGVYRKDKETGLPIKEGPRGQAYEKALRQMCGRMDAKFISYKVDGGVWKFEVEHFSRYGLMDIDDDDEIGVLDTTQAARAGNAAAAAPEEGVGEAPGAQPQVQRRLGLGAQDVEPEFASPMPIGRGLLASGLRGFALGAAGGPAASAAGRPPAQFLAEDSGVEPSVGAQRQQGLGLLSEAGGSETTGIAGGGFDQDMSEARAQLRFGDDLAAEAEISGGVVGPAAPGGGGGSTVTGPLAPVDHVTMEATQPAVPLQHALPASLAHDAIRMRALHDAFFSGSVGGTAGGEGAAVYGYRPALAQQQRPYALAGPTTAELSGGFAGVAAAGAVRGAGPGRVGAAGSTGEPPVSTTWRRPGAALTAGAPAAVMARGAALLSVPGDGGNGAGGSAAATIGSSPVSLALARPFTMRTPGAAVEGAGTMLPLRDVRTAGFLTDAGLAMGRAFRVGWGPGGRLVIPGAAEANSATEICITRVRVEGEGAAYGEMSYGSGAGMGGSEEAEGLEALRERLREALEVHLAASKPVLRQEESEDSAAAAGGGGGGEPTVPYWRLCIDSRELTMLVERYVRICEQQLQQLLSSGTGGGGVDAAGRSGASDVDADHPEALRLRHEIDTWRLVEVLFARIDGEIPDPEVDSGAGVLALPPFADAGVGTPGGEGPVGGDLMVLSTPPSTPPDLGLGPSTGAAMAALGRPFYDGTSGNSAEGANCAGEAVAGASQPQTGRTLLAALQRRAQLGLWLQRQARRRVEADLLAAGSPAAVVLHLLAAHQLAAAAGAAVAAGDARLAMLIARAGSRSSARSQVAAQLAIWQRSGFIENIASERLAAYNLIAGQVLEAQRLMSLDWRRLLGLHLWYGMPATASPMSAVQQYLLDRHVEPAVVPHPAPYHVEGLQPSATGAVTGSGAAAAGSTDVQWELLQLWSTTAAAATADCLAARQLATRAGVMAAAERARDAWLANGGCSRLLRCSGYSPNPLDHSLAWHLMTALQAVDVLPYPGSSDQSGSSCSSPYDTEILGTTLEFISQLLLVGGLSEWALYVALTIPDLQVVGSEDSCGVRRRVVREVLAMTVPEWTGDGAREAFLTATLHLPLELLAEAKANWAQHNGDDEARCAALIAAGDAAAAHDVFTTSVAPNLFILSSWPELSSVVSALEPVAAQLPAWDIGGGLYGNFLATFGRQLMAGSSLPSSLPPGGLEGLRPEALLELAHQVQKAQQSLEPHRVDFAAAVTLPVQVGTGTEDAATLRRRLVLSRIAALAQAACMSVSGSSHVRSACLQSGLALQGCVAAEQRVGGVILAAAEAGASVMCSS